MAFDPDSYLATAPAAPAGFNPDAFLAQSAEYSPVETVGLNASNLFGAAPAVVGEYQHLVHGKDYAIERDAHRARIEAANEQNPIAKWVGKVGALGAETLVGGGLGKVVSLGARATGLADALSPVAQKLGTIGTAALKGVAGGAAYGAAGGAGEALSEGKDVLPAAGSGAALGGALGGALGAAGGKLGEVLGDAKNLQRESIVRGASERALPKKGKALAALFDEAEPGGVALRPRSMKTDVTPGQVIDENIKILKGFRSGAYDDVARSSEAVSQKVAALEGPKAGHYQKVDEALHGGVPLKNVVDSLENKAAVETEAPWRKVTQDRANAVKAQYSTISTDEAKRLIASMHVPGDQEARTALEGLAEQLPEGKRWSRADFLDHLVGGERGAAVKGWADIPADLRRAVEGLPFRYDGTIKIPAQDLRKMLTHSQDEAESALGTLNATKNARLAALTQEVLGTTMDRVLDHAASLDPAARKAVQAIRDVNMRQSVLLRLNEAAARKIEKLQLGKPTLGGIAGHGVSSLLGGYEALSGFKHLLTGDVGGAAHDFATGLAAKLAPKAVVGAKRGAIDSLAWVQREAARGNHRAIRLLKAASAAKSIGTAGAGAVGSAATSTLGAAP